MWDIRKAITAGIAAAVSGLAILTLIAWLILRHPKLPHPGTLSLHDSVSVLQLIFASVAGAGALVGLIVAYRRQKVAEAGSIHDRTRVYNERFTTIATQLGDDKPAVRLAGVHAMAGLADDWETNRQTCIDVLCAYLRIRYEPEPGDQAPTAGQLAYQANREVRHTIIRLITAHLQPAAATSWCGMNLDFTGVKFDGGDFRHALFTGGKISFDGAVFADGEVTFSEAEFSGEEISFSSAEFCGTSFYCAVFSGGDTSFIDAKFPGGETSFARTSFSGGNVYFTGAKFSGGYVNFVSAEFSGSRVYFDWAEFSSGEVSFRGAKFTSSEVSFNRAVYSGGHANFTTSDDWPMPPRFDLPLPPDGVMGRERRQNE